MATYECDCKKAKKSFVYGRFNLTEVDKNGVCIHCGHYAIAVSQYHLHPRGVCRGGYRPIAKAMTLQTRYGYPCDFIYDLKGMDRWILIKDNSLRREYLTKKEKECKSMAMNT
jgi:hypothetical protein